MEIQQKAILNCWKCKKQHMQELKYGPNPPIKNGKRKGEIWAAYICPKTSVINEIKVSQNFFEEKNIVKRNLRRQREK